MNKKEKTNPLTPSKEFCIFVHILALTLITARPVISSVNPVIKQLAGRISKWPHALSASPQNFFALQPCQHDPQYFTIKAFEGDDCHTKYLAAYFSLLLCVDFKALHISPGKQNTNTTAVCQTAPSLALAGFWLFHLLGNHGGGQSVSNRSEVNSLLLDPVPCCNTRVITIQ